MRMPDEQLGLFGQRLRRQVHGAGARRDARQGSGLPFR